ncbi:MAG: SH3 domain protein [Halieaceae bacterium]|jgi:SH3 domain protein
MLAVTVRQHILLNARSGRGDTRPGQLLRVATGLLLLIGVLHGATAQEERYVSDNIFIVLHAGPGSNYRWLAKLMPGTTLVEQRQSTDGNWSEVSTERGTVGWVRSEHLSTEPPAQVRLPAIVRQLEDAEQQAADLSSALAEVRGEKSTVDQLQEQSASDAQRLAEELAALKQVSGSAIETAEKNRQLSEQAASMRLTIDTLEADNQRLQDRVSSSTFMDGALAVFLGAIITLVAPRLWPRKRSSSSWA